MVLLHTHRRTLHEGVEDGTAQKSIGAVLHHTSGSEKQFLHHIRMISKVLLGMEEGEGGSTHFFQHFVQLGGAAWVLPVFGDADASGVEVGGLVGVVVALDEVDAEPIEHGFVACSAAVSKAVFVESADFFGHVEVRMFETDAFEVWPAEGQQIGQELCPCISCWVRNVNVLLLLLKCFGYS